MYKMHVDPITGRILSYTKIIPTIQTYNDDILIDDSEVSKIGYNTIYINGEFIASEVVEKTDIEILSEKLYELSSENEQDYLMKLIIDEGMNLSDARTAVVERREQIDSLKNEISLKKQEHEEKVKKYYMKVDQDKEKDSQLAPKYYSAVIMVIKHENRYLKEWIDWHLELGFQHIYLYDNGTEEKVTEITETYPIDVQEKITVIDWSGKHVHLQQNAYEHFMEHFKQDVRWGIFIDSDEFVRFTDGVTANVNDFLKEYEDYTEIWGYEVEYDANGHEHYEDKPVRERFARQTNAREGFYWKNFVQVNRIDGWLMHYAQYNAQKHFLFKNEESNRDLFVIDHYYTKSWEEWQWKIKERGGADPKYHKALQEFFYYNPDMEYLNTGENVVQKYE